MDSANKVGTRGAGRTSDLLGGRYELGPRLGAGQTGQVFRARDRDTGETCAIKLFRASGDDRGAARALDEFGRLSDLGHPNIVRIRDAGRLPDGRLFLVSELLPGPTLSDRLDASPERFAQLAGAALRLADALAYLHGRGILHGDISPANVRYNAQDEPVLLDLGLACSLERRHLGGAAGTLGFIAPEALVGEPEPASDLFSLGATLYHAWTAVAPFGVGTESARRIWEAPATPPSALCPGLAPEWDELLCRLLAFAPEARPASARELLRLIHNRIPDPNLTVELCPPAPAGDPLAGVLVGRREQQRALLRTLEQLAEGAAPTAVVTVSGPPGSGRRSLIARVLRDARLGLLSGAMPALQIDEAGLGHLARLPDGAEADDPGRQAEARRAAMIQELEERARERPLCLVLGPGADEEAWAEAVASAGNTGRLLVVLPVEQGWARTDAMDLALRPLDEAEIQELARRAAGELPSEATVKRIARASGGLAAAAALLVRQWVRGEALSAPSSDEPPDLPGLLDRSFASLGPESRRWVTALALAPSPMRAAELAGFDPERSERAASEARAAGWLAPSGEALPGAQHLESVCRALAADPALADLAGLCATELPQDDPRRGEGQWALGQHGEAAHTFCAAARSAIHAERYAEAARWGLRALRIDSTVATLADRLDWSRALGIAGRYREALDLLDDACAASPGQRAHLAERRAWLLGRSGALNGARRILEQALDELGEENDELRVPMRARLARLLISAGLFNQALAAAAPAVHANSATAEGADHEAAILALAYLGRGDEADSLLKRMQPGAANDARLPAMRGLICQLAGRPREAAAAYREAVERYQASGDVHGLATAKSNLGCTLAETGQYSEALQYLPQATRELGRLRVATDLALALFNTGELLLQLGDEHGAGRISERLHTEAETARGDSFVAFAYHLDGDVIRPRQPDRAAALYAKAGETFARQGNQAMAQSAAFARAEAFAQAGQVKAAEEVWRTAAGDRAMATPSHAAPALAKARIALASPPDPQTDDALASTLSRLAETAQGQGRLPLALRAGGLAWRLWDRVGSARAAAELPRAEHRFEEIRMNTPPQFRAGLAAGLDAPRRRGDAEANLAPALERATRADARLRRLLRINKRLNSDLRLARVLETVIDTVIELTDAERGFLLLKDGSGELSVRVARNIDQHSLEGPEFTLSRSIAKQAADSGQPVMTVDAAGDQRFREALSVSDLHLRSVLAVPLAVKGNVVGTIYVDHRLRKGVFDDEALATVMDFGEQAAIAIENVRLIAELRRRENQVQALNRRLERELQRREADLQGAREELKISREAANLRYDYRQIVGQTPRMLELFHLLDRVTDTSLPVVIEGESGTGKELVARAIHFNGPRRERPFISENCAAIPETLLESTLFGHVKGAFTGADRESRGLFAVADGGTLFLDEVAEMSPGMQGKLLRVLQNGEFHRVGGERAQRVDVRIVAATNKDLARMVEQNKFRQDLFFRLAVVRLTLPPLRERREDIPLLIHHLLAKLAGGNTPPKSVEASAMARLCAYRWPGNVRELENEIARAAAFSGTAITTHDLSPHVAAASDPSLIVSDEPDGLRLRPRVERLETILVREAMQRFGGNQTKAADALGLSRFGLQKKLKRYRIA